MAPRAGGLFSNATSSLDQMCAPTLDKLLRTSDAVAGSKSARRSGGKKKHKGAIGKPTRWLAAAGRGKHPWQSPAAAAALRTIDGGSRTVVSGGHLTSRVGLGKTTQRLPPAPTADVVIEEQADVGAAARYIADQLRQGRPPAVRAVGADAANRAIKAVALARAHLAAGDLYVQVDCRKLKHQESLTLVLFSQPSRAPLNSARAPVLVSTSSAPGKVAGYLAQDAKEAARTPSTALGRTCVSAAGPEATLIALKAVALCARYLAGDGLELSLTPALSDAPGQAPGDVERAGVCLVACAWPVEVAARRVMTVSSPFRPAGEVTPVTTAALPAVCPW